MNMDLINTLIREWGAILASACAAAAILIITLWPRNRRT